MNLTVSQTELHKLPKTKKFDKNKSTIINMLPVQNVPLWNGNG